MPITCVELSPGHQARLYLLAHHSGKSLDRLFTEMIDQASLILSIHEWCETYALDQVADEAGRPLHGRE